MHSFFWPVFPIFWALVLAGAATLFVKGRRAGVRGGPPPSRTASAEQILAERYARGELVDEEYLQRSSVLRS
ncbi:SHOCT domain-containing protein [Nonomuraea sp. NPDC003754]